MHISNHTSAFQGSVPLAAEAGSTLRLRATGVVVRSDGRVTVCMMEESAFRAEEIGEDGELAASAPDVGLAA